MHDTGPRILVVDGDPTIRFYPRKALTGEGYAVAEAASGEPVLRVVAEAPPHLLLLDSNLPDLEGIGLIDAIRNASPLPISALSSREQEDVVVGALDHGVDDIVRKPFTVRELLARVRNALRRTAHARGEVPHCVSGALEVDVLCRRFWAQGRPVRLSRIECALLCGLVDGGGRALSHRELLETVWGPAWLPRRSYPQVAIRALRRKVEADPERPTHVPTEPGAGYRFQTPMKAAGTRRRPGETE